jgi:hypothetical protein
MSDYWPSDEDDFEVLDGNPMEKAHGATSLVGMGSDHIAAELGEDLIRLDEEVILLSSILHPHLIHLIFYR